MAEITKESYEKEGRKLDGVLKESEMIFLKNYHTEIIADKESFSKSFGLGTIIENIKNGKPVSKEQIAFVQAYLFDNPKEIDGRLGPKTKEKVKNHLNKNTGILQPGITNNPNKETQYLQANRKLSDSKFKKYFSGLEQLQQGQLGDCYLITAINVLARCPYFATLMQTAIKIGKNKKEETIIQVTMPLGEPGGIKVNISQEELSLAKVKGMVGYKVLEIAFAKYITKQTTLKSLDSNELQIMAGGRSGYALQTLLGGKSLSGFTLSAKNGTQQYKPTQYIGEKGIGKEPTLSDMNNKDKGKIIGLLKAYNLEQGKGFLTVGTTAGSDRTGYKVGENTLYHGHAYAVLGTEKNPDGSIKFIKVLNPRNNNKTTGGAHINMTLDEFMGAFGNMDVSLLTNNFLNETTNKEEITITDQGLEARKKRQQKKSV